MVYLVSNNIQKKVEPMSMKMIEPIMISALGVSNNKPIKATEIIMVGIIVSINPLDK
jgi:hypothetical protein